MQQVSLRLSQATALMIRYACQQGLLKTNQMGNVRPDIPPSQNNCVEQTEWSKWTVHCFHEEGGEKSKASWIRTPPKLRNSMVQQVDSARGLPVHRKRVECACAALCIVTYRNITEHPSPLIDTVNHCTDTRWTIALLDNTCDIDMSDQWLTALMGLYQRIKCKQRQLFLLPFFPFQPCRVKIGYYHSPRKALQNKVPRPANPTDFLCSTFLKLRRNSKTVSKAQSICIEEMKSLLLICKLDWRSGTIACKDTKANSLEQIIFRHC